MNKPLPRSHFGKAFGEGWERIFGKAEEAPEENPALLLVDIHDLKVRRGRQEDDRYVVDVVFKTTLPDDVARDRVLRYFELMVERLDRP